MDIASCISDCILDDKSSVYCSNNNSLKREPKSGCITRSPLAVNKRFFILEPACSNVVCVLPNKPDLSLLKGSFKPIKISGFKSFSLALAIIYLFSYQ